MVPYFNLVSLCDYIILQAVTCTLNDLKCSCHSSFAAMNSFAMDVVPRLFTQVLHVYALNHCIRSIMQTPQLFISSINFVLLLFESGDYLRVLFVLLSQSLRWCRREQSSIEWLLDRQGNLLVVADWFTSLFWVYCLFHDEFSHVHVLLKYSLHTLQLLFESGAYSARVELRLLFESCY